MNIKEIHQLFLNTSGVCTDTRKIQKNQIYFALKGDHFDGNKFVNEAFKKGASYAIVDDYSLRNQPNCVFVENTLDTLQSLANFHRNYLSIPIIGITGSNGKTTTKKLVNSLLSKKFKTQATQGNLNNHIGVPLTLLSFHSQTEYGIVEMGANHQKEIDFLCSIATPDYGLITNFGKAHLEGFGGVEGVIKGKSELYQYLSKKNNGIAFINKDDAKQVELTKQIKTISVGRTAAADYQFELHQSFPFIKFSFKDTTLTVSLSGEYNFQNVINAVGIAIYFGVEIDLIKRALKEFEPEENRSQFIQKKSHKILLDAYNANPSSMEASIKNFSQHQNEKSLILGDMFEIGKDAEKEHFNIYKLCQQEGFNQAYFCGRLFYRALENEILPKGYQVFETYEALAASIQKSFSENQFILIKGSRGMQLERILAVL
ncbi:UDP-N-acetylmuramoyl-tripeptide--D-alanyl-D-alanine ligase [Psychroflexus maritimus]|uniref:UDP-N-acetylmuramoyl-tripeptide--D-alanyl-D-alanine ligase n=1 Tax=Psychroflexus maritimus TaxID=2714865 RepID=A0A967AF54_9FLAO|nr:UDP-N-acetylmuramoyl-tripeptide--D-alanyl-D-alanine ligase [Psychroflexus maritimus]NGZ89371.1 UDP-N-acetylmuramoyl-tripeptide--D-alanyl-D-alanine ligase [Psychroflexus maritimus]